MKRSFLCFLTFSLLIFIVTSLMTPPAFAQVCNDLDGDGFGDPASPTCTYNFRDCDDNDPLVYPFSPNLKRCDGKDTNCDGRFPDIPAEADADGDGFPQCNDCNDTPVIGVNINPGAIEGPPGDPTCGDGIDNDCDFLVDTRDPTCQNPCVDNDRDTFYSVNSLPGCTQPMDDCNDSNPNINPGIVDDSCNNVDNNCSGTPDDEYVIVTTSCGIGICASTGTAQCINGAVVNDCAPGLPGVEDGEPADPVCTDGLDNDCDGDTDAADDGCAPCMPTGQTDDNCDGIDDDCNGTPDDLFVPQATTCGQGICLSSGTATCENGALVDDCVPGPAGTEAGLPDDPECNDGLDNDCDGIVDECQGCNDQDGDDFGDPGSPLCPFPQRDCDDNDPLVYPFSPFARSTCDGKDTNCDGARDFPTDKDEDRDGFLACGMPADCNDLNPNVYPGRLEGPPGDPTCFDGVDNDCDIAADGQDNIGVPNCVSWEGNCPLRIEPKNGPHLFDLLDPDNPSFRRSPCVWCHFDDTQTIDQRRACQRCHADPSDTSNPLNGVLKALYPLDPPYGFGTAINVRTHLYGAVSPVTPPGCMTCHNPHLQEQDLRYGTSYGKLIKEFICYDETAQGNRFEERVEITAPFGPGSFADGPPFNENICEMCHTQTNHHQRDGTAPGGQSHFDAQNCTECHPHIDGFAPTGGEPAPPHDTPLFLDPANCDFCHVSNTDFSTPVPDAKCAQCHTTQAGNLKDQFPAEFGTAPDVITHSGKACVECHNPMFPQPNLKLIRPSVASSIIPGSIIEFTAFSGPGSFADGPPFNENICNTCHSQTNHHQSDGSAPGGQSHNDGSDCRSCHPHIEGFAPVAEATSPHNTEFFNANCQFCHVETGGVIDFAAPVPDASCQRCHGERSSHTSDTARNQFATGNYVYDIMCIDCHDPMFPVGGNRKLLKESIDFIRAFDGSNVMDSIISNTTRRGAGSLADGAPHDENVCESCHSLTAHNRFDLGGQHLDGVDRSGEYCMICHDHNNSFMIPGRTCDEENEPGISCTP